MPQMTVAMILILIILASGWLIYFYNIMTNKKMKVEELYHQLIVLINNKSDLALAIAKKVSQYSNGEIDLLINMGRRYWCIYLDANSIIESSERMSKLIETIFELGPYYLEIDTKEMNEFKEQLTSVEKKLSKSIQLYNASVEVYNKFIFAFPNNFAAMMIGIKELPYLKSISIKGGQHEKDCSK